MAHLVVVAYPDEMTAARAWDRLVDLQRQRLITLADAAIAVRGNDGKVKIKQARNLTGAGAVSGAFWGTLIGLIFMVPLVGMVAGAAMGALSTMGVDIGVDDSFIKEVGAAITPGSSALFLLITEVTPDKVMEEMREFGGKVIRTNLTQEQETKLHEAFDAA